MLDTPTKLNTKMGKMISIIPLGNAARKRVPAIEQVTTVELVKVGVTKAYFRILGMKQGFSINGDLDKHSNGYLAFNSKEEAVTHLHTRKLAVSLRQMDFTKLSTAELVALHTKLAPKEK